MTRLIFSPIDQTGAAGQATLTDTGDSLTWQITESPAAEFYLPQQATLKKQQVTIPAPFSVPVIAVAAAGRVWFVTQGKLTVINPPGLICDEAASEQVRQAK